MCKFSLRAPVPERVLKNARGRLDTLRRTLHQVLQPRVDSRIVTISKDLKSSSLAVAVISGSEQTGLTCICSECTL